MKRLTLPRSGQGLLEAIIGIGIILAGTVGTITLMMSTIKANRSSIDKAVAANLAREAVETARNFRDANWLAIQSNTDAVWQTETEFEPVGTFDDLFKASDAAPHHVRIPVFYRYFNEANFSWRDKPYPDGNNDNYLWVFEDPSNFWNYNAAADDYTDPVDYRNGYDSVCIYKYNNQPVTYDCSQVFENLDVRYSGDTYRGLGYGYFNEMPPTLEFDTPRPAWQDGPCIPHSECDRIHTIYGDPKSVYPLIDPLFFEYINFDDRSQVRPADEVADTTATRYKRWIKFDPICRLDMKDAYGSNVSDGIPDVPATERVEPDEREKCGATEIMVGLRLQSTVCWDTCASDKTVMIEDRLYNWKYVK